MCMEIGGIAPDILNYGTIRRLCEQVWRPDCDCVNPTAYLLRISLQSVVPLIASTKPIFPSGGHHYIFLVRRSKTARRSYGSG